MSEMAWFIGSMLLVLGLRWWWAGHQERAIPPVATVLLHNDDSTPMGVITLLLEHVFSLSAEQSFQVMMNAHQHGTAVVCSLV